MALSKNIYSDFLEDQIVVQTENMRLLSIWFIVLLLLGTIASILLYIFDNELDSLLKIGPSIIMAALSSFPLKTVMVNRERVSAFRSLKLRIDSAQDLPAERIKAIEQIVEDTIKELIKR